MAITNTQASGYSHMTPFPVALDEVAASGSTPLQAERPSPRLRLTRRGQMVVAALAAVPIVALMAFLSFGSEAATASGVGSSAVVEYVTVAAGDSLWGIAEEIAPSADPREVVAQILRFNALDSADVVAGQRIAVPTQYTVAS